MDRKDLQQYLSPLSKLNLAEPALDVYSNLTNRYAHLENIDPEIVTYELSENECHGEVLLPLIHTQGQTVFLVIALAHALRCRGYRPLIAICNSDLPLCLRKEGHPDDPGTCVNCHYHSLQHLESYGMTPIYLEEYVSEIDESAISNVTTHDTFEHKGVDLRPFALATARRFLRKYSVDIENSRDRDVYLRFLKSGMIVVDATKAILQERDVLATVGHHPAYVYAGAMLEATRDENIPAVSYGAGYLRKGSVIFGNMKNRKGFTLFSDHDELRRQVEKPLNSQQKQKVDDLMNGRRDGTTLRESHFYTKDTDDTIELDEDLPTIGLFTNLLWDGSLIDCNITFDDPFDWVSKTIEIVQGRDIQLIVKPHPAEAKRETNEPMKEWIETHIDPLPENIYLLPADTKVNPYQLIDVLDAGIVYNSTFGLEMAYDGLPVVVVGDTHYRDLGFTYDPLNPSEYERILDEFSDLTMTEDMQNRVQRYAHYLLTRRHINFDFAKLGGSTDTPSITHEELDAGNETLDHVIEQVFAGETAITSEESL